MTPTAPAAGDLEADAVIVGGGYTGLWTAWQLLERGARVVLLEADVCGHGPSGRNGGFCETLWSNLPSLRERFDDERALAACRASSDSVSAIGAWCEQEGVDAWFRRLGVRDGVDERGPGRRDRPDRRRRRHRPRPGRRPRRGGAPRPLRLAALPARAPRPRRRQRPARAARARAAPPAARARRRDPRALARARAARGTGDGGRRDGVRPRAGGRGRARAQRRHPRRAPAAVAPVGDLVAHRPHRAGARRPRADRLDRGRDDHRRAHVRALLPHDAGRPDRVRLGRRAARLGRPARRARRGRRRDGGRRPASTWSRCCPPSPGAGSPTPGEGRSTSRPATCPRSARSTTAPCTTRSASRATASGPRTSPAGRWRAWCSGTASPCCSSTRRCACRPSRSPGSGGVLVRRRVPARRAPAGRRAPPGPAHARRLRGPAGARDPRVAVADRKKRGALAL